MKRALPTIGVKIFALLAGLGFAVSTAAHFGSFFGFDTQQVWPYFALILHVGMFVVLIAAMFTLPGRPTELQFRWRALVAHAPRWMRWLAILLFINAVFDIAAFQFVCGLGGPRHEADGTYSIASHGRAIRQITAAEYQRACGYEFRSFSGFWMLCYGLASMLLISEINRRKRPAIE